MPEANPSDAHDSAHELNQAPLRRVRHFFHRHPEAMPLFVLLCSLAGVTTWRVLMLVYVLAG